MFDILIPLLRRIPALHTLTEQELFYLIENIQNNVVNYEAKQIIIHDKELDNNLYLILEGRSGTLLS